LAVNVKTQDGEGFQVFAIEPPPHAVAYDVFAGASESTLGQQNDEPVMAGEWWGMPSSGLKEGEKPGDGQAPDYWVRHERILRRG
jgi:hypothetical protein